MLNSHTQVSFFSSGRRIASDNRGAALLEFVIVLPLLSLLIFAVIELGWYMIRFEAITRAISLTSESIASGNNITTQSIADNFAAGLIPLGNGTSYICAQAYSTYAKASVASPYCTNGTWALGGGSTPPNCDGTATACPSSYYVGLAAYAQPMSLTGLVSEIIPQGTAISPKSMIVPVGPVAGGGGSGLPTSCTAGQTITWDTTTSAFVCSSAPPGSIGGGCYTQGFRAGFDDENGGTNYVGWGNAQGATASNFGGNYYTCAGCPAGYKSIQTAGNDGGDLLPSAMVCAAQ